MENKIQDQALKVRYRENSRDIVFTPKDLAAALIKMVPIKKNDYLMDPCKGTGAFIDNFPEENLSCYCEITEDIDFFSSAVTADWLISNPPYSILNEWLEKSCKLAQKGFAYLVGSYSMTPKRLEIIEKYGFKMRSIHYVKVQQWFGISAFVVFEKGYKGKVDFTYDRKIWKGSTRILSEPEQLMIEEFT